MNYTYSLIGLIVLSCRSFGHKYAPSSVIMGTPTNDKSACIIKRNLFDIANIGILDHKLQALLALDLLQHRLRLQPRIISIKLQSILNGAILLLEGEVDHHEVSFSAKSY